MEGSNTAGYPFCAVLQAFPWYNVLVAALLAQVISSGNHRQFQRSRQRMRTPIRRWQFRGLVLHHRRHPATHSRRLVNRTARWGEPPVNGICRWCYERTASIKTRWHRYCLNAYRATSSCIRHNRTGPSGDASRVHAGEPTQHKTGDHSWTGIARTFLCRAACVSNQSAACKATSGAATRISGAGSFSTSDDYLSCWCRPDHTWEYSGQFPAAIIRALLPGLQSVPAPGRLDCTQRCAGPAEFPQFIHQEVEYCSIDR